MELIDAAQLAISIVLATVTVRQANVTHRLEQRLYRLNTNLDQSIQRLQRAREAVIQQHKASAFLHNYTKAMEENVKTEVPDTYFEKRAELDAYTAELRGLAFAIGDKELLEIVNRSLTSNDLAVRVSEEWGRAQDLHTRISQLLLEATAEAPSSNQNSENWRTV